MNLNLSSGYDIPYDVNVVIEIPAFSQPIKYEVDKPTGMLFVDRFMATSMVYPCNYGYIPNTLANDGDPADVLVVTPFPVINHCVIRCRPIGMLKMTDESGNDNKIIAVPVDKLSVLYHEVRTLDDLPLIQLSQISHFFEHYKDLEPNKWVKIDGWGTPKEAQEEIIWSVEHFQSSPS